MRLLRIISLRLLYGLVSLLFIQFVTFITIEVAPGGPEYIMAGEKATPEAIERLREQMGLNRPWPVRFGEYLMNTAKFDFGKSLYGTRENISDVLKRTVPMTFRLAVWAITIASVTGIFLGVIGAVYHNKWPDKLVLTISTLGVTIPTIVLAPILTYLACMKFGWFPLTWEVYRYEPDWKYLFLPIAILAMRPAAMVTRLCRAQMVDTLQQEFIKFAKAKGVHPIAITIQHALRNAILPIITGIGISFGFLLTGSFILEMIFIIPGLGHETIEAINRRNTPVIQGCVLTAASIFIVMNLIIDVLLPILDPRIREARV